MSETVAASSRFEAATKSILTNAGAAASQKKIASSFDRSLHHPFRLDNRGMNKEMNMKEADKQSKLNVSN